MTVYEVMNI